MIGLVHFVDQQDAAVFLAQCLEQRSCFQEFLGEEDVAELVQASNRLGEAARALQDFIERLLQHLRVQQLLAVLPFIQRLGFIQPFVALQPDQRQLEHLGSGLREFGLADARRAFDQNRLAQVIGKIHRGRNLI